MDGRIKKITLLSLCAAVLGEVVALLYISRIYPTLNWELILGSLLLITGITLLIDLCLMRKAAFRNKGLYFYGLLINPVLVSIFLGIALLAMQDPHLDHVNTISLIVMSMSMIIGFALLIAAIFRTKA